MLTLPKDLDIGCSNNWELGPIPDAEGMYMPHCLPITQAIQSNHWCTSGARCNTTKQCHLLQLLEVYLVWGLHTEEHLVEQLPATLRWDHPHCSPKGLAMIDNIAEPSLMLSLRVRNQTMLGHIVQAEPSLARVDHLRGSSESLQPRFQLAARQLELSPGVPEGVRFGRGELAICQ